VTEANNIENLNRILAWNCVLYRDILKRKVKRRENVVSFGMTRSSIVCGTLDFFSRRFSKNR
jgi:hypothetical protein